MDLVTVTATAPATVANVGPGFDTFGFALEGPVDTVRLERTRRRRVRLVNVDGDNGLLSRRVRKNVASAVIHRIWKEHKPPFGVDVFLTKGLPLGSGMGSSAASSAAAVMAADAILGTGFDRQTLLRYAMYGEKVACGTAHADNVAPALFGGFTVVRADEDGLITLPCRGGWYVAVIRPHMTITTRAARKVLPWRVRLGDHVANTAEAVAVTLGVERGDFALFAGGVNRDRIVSPRRSRLLPMVMDVANAARRSGPVAFGISGSGPAMFAVTDQGPKVATVIAEDMREACVINSVAADVHVGLFGAIGAQVRKADA